MTSTKPATRTLRPFAPDARGAIIAAVYSLQSARDKLRKAGAGNAADYVARALKSAQGAERHALRIEHEHRRRAAAGGNVGDPLFACGHWHEIVERLANGIMFARDTCEKSQQGFSAFDGHPDNGCCRGHVRPDYRRGTDRACWRAEGWAKDHSHKMRARFDTEDRARAHLRKFLAALPS